MRSFKQRYGITIHVLIARERIEFAKRLLERRHLPVKEIALRSGYGSLPNFSRDFSRVVGISPVAWRGDGLAAERPLPDPYLREEDKNPIASAWMF